MLLLQRNLLQLTGNINHDPASSQVSQARPRCVSVSIVSCILLIMSGSTAAPPILDASLEALRINSYVNADQDTVEVGDDGQEIVWKYVNHLGDGLSGQVWLESAPTQGKLRAVKLVWKHGNRYLRELQCLGTLKDVLRPRFSVPNPLVQRILTTVRASMTRVLLVSMASTKTNRWACFETRFFWPWNTFHMVILNSFWLTRRRIGHARKMMRDISPISYYIASGLCMAWGLHIETSSLA